MMNGLRYDVRVITSKDVNILFWEKYFLAFIPHEPEIS